jgi:acetyl-CoA hydrolase
MEWKHRFANRLSTPTEAVEYIKSGFRIFLMGNCSVPQSLLTALVKKAPALQNVEICQALTVCGSDYVAPELEGHLRVNSFFSGANVRQAINEGRADYTPVLLSEFPLVFSRGVVPLDAAFVHLSPPDEDGYCTYGIEAGLTRTAAETAKMIIAEVNEQMPAIYGDTKIHIDDVDVVVPVDYPLGSLNMSEDTKNNGHIIDKIGQIIAERIPDEATLQTGIGVLPDTVLKHLKGKKNLGVHSELFSDGIIDLVEAGVINGACKSIHPHKITAGFLLGTKRLFDWANKNPMVELQRTEYINNPFTIAKNHRMVALNSAIEVDLTGQVCSDSIGHQFYSGAGGQLDFIFGSSMSEGGLPIIALPSSTTNRHGECFSRIVSSLKPGAGVITTRSHVHFICTEYGMVDLYGKTVRERAKLLISIAHPDFRDKLMFEAQQLKYI